MTVRAGARIVWDKPPDERLEYAYAFLGQSVVVHHNSGRESKHLTETAGTVVAVALPTAGQANEVVIERPGYRYAIAVSLAHVYSITRQPSPSSSAQAAELEAAGQLAIDAGELSPAEAAAAGAQAAELERPTSVAAGLDGKLVPTWHPAPGTRYYRTGDTVRIDGMVGRRFIVQGFRLEAGEWTVDLIGARGDKQAGQLRTLPAKKLRRP